MNLFLSCVLLFLLDSEVYGRDVVCSGKVETTIEVNQGETFRYRTQPKTKTRCAVTYTKGEKCSGLEFSCSKFNVKNTKKSCGKQDRMIVTADGQKKKFCKKKSPKMTALSSLKVVWFGRKGSSSRAKCSVTCVGSSETTTTGLSNINFLIKF